MGSDEDKNLPKPSWWQRFKTGVRETVSAGGKAVKKLVDTLVVQPVKNIWNRLTGPSPYPGMPWWWRLWRLICDVVWELLKLLLAVFILTVIIYLIALLVDSIIVAYTAFSPPAVISWIAIWENFMFVVWIEFVIFFVLAVITLLCVFF